MRRPSRFPTVKIAAGVVTAALAALLGWMVLIEPERLTVRRSEVELPGLPAAFDGLKVVLLSDFHAFPTPDSPSLLRRVAATVAAERPDLICLLGDYMHDRKCETGGELADLSAYFRQFSAPLGVYAVLGNHEMWHDCDQVGAALRAAGVTVLENDAVALNRRGERLHLGGTGDLTTGKVDFSRVFRNWPVGEFGLLLAHNPETLRWQPRNGLLMLAGHTHGGQVRLPWIGDFRRLFYRGDQRLPSDELPENMRSRLILDLGLHSYGDKYVYVTSGLGGNRLRLRLLCLPEIAVVTLRQVGRAAAPDVVNPVKFRRVK